jgi:phospho-N-acetylmuramoyl-pentapeptide-transferase
MLLYLFYHVLEPYFHALNLFRYITVRTALASLTALMITLVLGPWVIRRLRELQIGQFIREEGPESHQSKAGTPTMGGVLIVGSAVVVSLEANLVENDYVWLAGFIMLFFGAICLIDYYSKIKKKRNLGLTGTHKFSLQIIASCVIAITLLTLTATGIYSTQLSVPFFKNFRPDLVIHSLLPTNYFWWLSYFPFLIFVALVIVGSSNAVNLTDGLDGLAIGCVVVAASALTVLTYVTSFARFSAYLDLQHLPEVGELTVFCGALVGSSLGFLWYNAHPAEVFMGDVGSLALGGSIGMIAVAIKQEILLFFVGGVFVLEALSVILQVLSFRLTGKRIFRMSPLHHHFELSGWSESKTIVRFWIAALVFALFSLTTLKLR